MLIWLYCQLSVIAHGLLVCNITVEIFSVSINNYSKLEIRSVERGICHIATSTMNELFL